MKTKSILMFALFVIFAFAAQSATAQITITIPKLPKIKKPKTDTNTTVNTTTETQNQTTKTDSSMTGDASGNDGEQMDSTLSFFLEEIAKAQKSVDKYNSDDYLYLVSGGAEAEWLLRAVSLREREKWTSKWLKKSYEQKKFAAALDSLSVSAAKKMPIYIPNNNNFAFHNLAEEKMMKATLKNAATLKIVKIGLYHGNWQISKDDYNLPTARYKQGYIWVRDSADDHPYCHLYQVNIIQDYAGGGTYAASYARFLNDALFGCPAGQ